MKPIFLWLILIALFPASISLSAQEPTCNQAIKLAPYHSDDKRDFIRLEAQSLMDGDSPYQIAGINYYPMNSPWRRFLTETDIADVRHEFEIFRSAGINTLRIFLWNAVLFQCDGRSNLPVSTAFERLDAIIHTASEYDLRLIITLNDMPDLNAIALYDNPQVVQDQTQFIVLRYRDEPVILAWDLKNEGDIDYGSQDILQTRVARVTVLAWLQATSELVRSIDSNHLITAGWLNDAQSTAAYVDFVSFHHWTSADDLKRRILQLRYATTKPILLEEVGYSTLHENITYEVQAQLLGEVIQVATDENLLGWMVWTAFDFPLTATCYPSPCVSPDNAEHYFGIWTGNYEAKPAVAIIQQYAG